MTRGRLATVWVRAGLLAAVVAFGLSGCQALQDALPTQNSEPKPSPSQSPVAIPVVVPQPTPTPILGVPGPAPSPTPTSSPGPAPTPTPAPPSNGSCSLPPSNSPNAPCVALSPLFLASVENAITQITQQQPSIFGPPTSNCPNCYFVKDVNAYVTGVIRNLNAAGFCGHYDGEELGVKNTNSFNEQYDILLASGHIRRGSGAYRTTCTPSWF